MNHLTPEEIKARHAEVSQRRNSTFEAERKSRRVKKIKSKAYHRIRRGKERKMAEKLGDAAAVHDLDDEEVRMRLETERARERATLRHKNTGKWARAMRGRNELDVDQRQELNDDHTRAEKLRRRIQGIGSGEEDSDSDDSDSDADIEAVKAAAFDELRALRAEGPIDPADGVSKKSVLRMKFMQDAMKRDMHRVNQSIDDFMNEMGGQMDSKDRDGSEPPLPADGEASVQRSNGRVSYRPGQTVSRNS
jgi:U3 small nucleolar RNA-associated protein 14